MRPRSARVALAALVAAACGSPDGTAVVVTVQARASVLESNGLHVTLENDGDQQAKDFALAEGDRFPVTFTVTPAGRTGTLHVAVDAIDDVGQLTGRGEGSVRVEPDARESLAVILEPYDFVVNQGVAGSQTLASYSEQAGRQLARGPDGAFLGVWLDVCEDTPCDVHARRFDDTVRPIDDDFAVNLTDQYTQAPSLAGGLRGYLVSWLTQAPGQQARLMATVLAADGSHVGDEQRISRDGVSAAFPTAIPLASGSYAIAWHQPRDGSGAYEVRARLLDMDGVPTANPVSGDALDFAVSSSDGGDQFAPHGAGFADEGFTVVWVHNADGKSEIHARSFGLTGAPSGDDVVIASYDVGYVYEPRVATREDELVVVWRYTSPPDTQLVLRRFSRGGDRLSTEIPVAEATAQASALMIAHRDTDDALGVAWHDCDDRGDGHGCGIRFRLFRPTGMPCGDDVVVNSTVAADQRNPSLTTLGDGAFLVAWNDESMTAPDTDGGAIRARAIYPSLGKRNGEVGSVCGDEDVSCDDGLACATTPAGDRLCHEVCAGSEAGSCTGGGVCTGGVCVFP